MNKLFLTVSALFALLVLVSAVRDLPEGEIHQEDDDEHLGSDHSLLDGGLRNPVGKAAADLWGEDIHENGVPKAVDSKQRICAERMMGAPKCKTCCNAKGYAWRYSRYSLRCTCFQTDNHYQQ